MKIKSSRVNALFQVAARALDVAAHNRMPITVVDALQSAKTTLRITSDEAEFLSQVKLADVFAIVSQNQEIDIHQVA